MSSDKSPDLPPLPHDPPDRQLSIHSAVESSGTSLTDTESYSRRSSRSRESSSGIYGEISRTFKKLQTQLLDEKRRADEAERRLEEVTAHLKTVNDARLRAMQDGAQAREDLRLYKIQLDHAQREIFRAQDAIAIVDRQRHSAEKEAAKNRSKARQLNETLLVQAAREEAWRVGMREGLNRGRNIALAEISDVPYDPIENTVLDEESSQSSSDTEKEDDFPIRVQSVASSVRSRSARDSRFVGPSIAGPSAPPDIPIESVVPPTRPNSRAQSMRSVVDPIRPISVQNMIPRLPSPAILIPDNFIPSLDADNMIRIPAPFAFSRTPERQASPQLPPESVRSMEALPIPPPSEPSISQRRRTGHRRNSSSDSSTLSALDIVNEPFGTLRTPMSAIQEVSSQYTASPHHQAGDDGDIRMQHQPSFSGSYRHPPGYASSGGRPGSRASFAPSQFHSYHENPDISPPPDIAVQPPSRDSSFRVNTSPEYRRSGTSPASQASQIRILPANIIKPVSVQHGMPGGMDFSTQNNFGPTSEFPRSPGHGSSRLPGEDDAVSSALSGATLTTPVGRYHSLDNQYSDAAGLMGGRPPSAASRHGSVNTGVYSVPDSAGTEDMAGVGTVKHAKKRGKRK